MKRLSGGRGEYELAERNGPYGANDLIDLPIVLDCTPFASRTTNIVPRAQGDKPRLRRTDNGIHLHRQVAALTMLPKPVRDETVLPVGLPVVRQDAYVLRKMEIDALAVGTQATLRLGRLEMDNASMVPEFADFGDRLARGQAIYGRALDLPDPLRDLILQHQAIAAATTPVTVDAERLVLDIMRATAALSADFSIPYTGETDVMPVIEAMLAPLTAPPPPSVTAVPLGQIEIRRRNADQLREYLTRRGIRTAAFRRSVKEAYRYTCAFCGLRYPTTAKVTPGVDAAHILPWASYDLDVVANGLCLCKVHHWAFDQQLLAVRVDGANYEVVLTDRARTVFAAAGATLAALGAVAGTIPTARLPFNVADRPRKEFFEELYRELPV